MKDIEEAKQLTVKENAETLKRLVADWGLGPSVGIDNMQGNASFWISAARKWNISVEEARRRSCANCEYGEISPEYLEAMEHIPYNKYDKDGGMRVWCEKWDFICHALRVCQSWDPADEED